MEHAIHSELAEKRFNDIKSGIEETVCLHEIPAIEPPKCGAIPILAAPSIPDVPILKPPLYNSLTPISFNSF